MFFGAVEANTGEILNIRHPNGTIGGNPILAFSTALHNYCDGVKSVEAEWIKRLESHTQEPLCSSCNGLITALIEGDWEYGTDYDLYVRRSGEPKMSREDFWRNVTMRDNAWIDIQALMNCARQLVALIQAHNPDTFEWDAPEALILDLEALIHTLSILMERNATEVRVLIF